MRCGQSGHLRVEHVDSDFGGGLNGPEVSQQGVSVQDGSAGFVARRLNQNLVRRTGAFAQRPPHVGQLLLQSTALCKPKKLNLNLMK